MSNYDVFNARVNDKSQYEKLQGHIYGGDVYTSEEISYYANKLSFGFIGRIKVFLAHALASVGLINGVERDARIAAEVNEIGKRLIQQIGKETGYYAQDRAVKVSLFSEGDMPQEEAVEEAVDVFSLKSRCELLTDAQKAQIHVDSQDIGLATVAIKRALEKIQPKVVQASPAKADRSPKIENKELESKEIEPAKRPPAFDLPQTIFTQFPKG